MLLIVSLLYSGFKLITHMYWRKKQEKTTWKTRRVRDIYSNFLFILI